MPKWGRGYLNRGINTLRALFFLVFLINPEEKGDSKKGLGPQVGRVGHLRDKTTIGPVFCQLPVAAVLITYVLLTLQAAVSYSSASVSCMLFDQT